MSKKLNIWLCDFSHNYVSLAMNKMPLAAGMIAAYCRQNIQTKYQYEVFKTIQEMEAELEKGKIPKIIGFSNYMWNQDLNLNVARICKSIYPDCIIVFGGPNFPLDMKRQKKFLQRNDWVDFYVLFEGELAFANLVTILEEKEYNVGRAKVAVIPQTVSLVDDTVVAGPLLPRLDMSEFPSPYLMGIFDKYIKKLVPMVQKTRGCPFQCTYCFDALKVGNTIKHRSLDLMKEELEYIVENCNRSFELYITDANFGMYKEDIEYCQVIRDAQEKNQWPWLIALNTGKQHTKRIYEAARLTSGAMTVAAAVQSTDPDVLKNIKRKNLPFRELIWLAKETRNLGDDTYTYSQIILSLPGDTVATHKKSIYDMVDSGMDAIDTFQLMLLPGTALESLESRTEFALQTKHRVLPRCFGQYQFMAEEFQSAEIEEICVATNTMSFDEYIESRVIDLNTAVFYNDSVLMDLYDFLRKLGVKPSEVLEEINCHSHEKLQEVYDGFTSETRGELFLTPEEIMEMIKTEGIINEYANGTRGANLIYKYKVLALINHWGSILDVAYAAACKILSKRGLSHHFDFLIDLKKYNQVKLDCMLDPEKEIEVKFNYNILEYKDSVLGVDALKNETKTYVVRHTEKQKKILWDQLALRGNDLNGMTKILAQLPLKKIYRKEFAEIC